jgi:hypothetical protein
MRLLASFNSSPLYASPKAYGTQLLSVTRSRHQNAHPAVEKNLGCPCHLCSTVKGIASVPQGLHAERKGAVGNRDSAILRHTMSTPSSLTQADRGLGAQPQQPPANHFLSRLGATNCSHFSLSGLQSRAQLLDA